MEKKLESLRIAEHPILTFDRGKSITIFFEGKPYMAYEHETVAAALYAQEVKIFSRSFKYRRPRGFFCAIGRCSACMMEVDGVPNIRTCMVTAKDGMRIKRQKGFPSADTDIFGPFIARMDLSPASYLKRFVRPPFLRNIYGKILRKMAGIGRIRGDVRLAVAGNESYDVDVAIVGGGPAGLSAAIEAGQLGVSVLLIDDKYRLGGQLIKQTHKFFGNSKYCAGKRGFRLADEMIAQISELKNVQSLPNTSVFGYYPADKVLAAVGDGKFVKVKAKKYVVATGAYERTLIFENNDLPGVYGAGGAQTLMNVYGIRPGSSGLMVGSGNVGLIVTYQLIQAGVGIEAILEALPTVGGYLVHASKVSRLGVPILTRHTVVKALGKKQVEGALIAQLDERWNQIPGSVRKVACDFICISVGLNPTYDLIQHFTPEVVFLPDLGGFVPLRDKFGRVNSDAYIAGDCSGIEEAATAMFEGAISGLHAATSLGYGDREAIMKRIEELLVELEDERSSPCSLRIRKGLREAVVDPIKNQTGV